MLCVIALLVFLLCCADVGAIFCPKNSDGYALECPFKCCESKVDAGTYYCCGSDKLVEEIHGDYIHDPARPERFIAYGASAFKVDYTLLIIGLIVSIILSILCSFFCCLLCNGCWLHRRRNPQLYESVSESGFYPLCCGFGVPLGTVVFSTHPPQFREENDMYHESSTSSIPSGRSHVRFNEDGALKGVLKNNSNNYPHNYER